jgi:hypothetical protein
MQAVEYPLSAMQKVQCPTKKMSIIPERGLTSKYVLQLIQ